MTRSSPTDNLGDVFALIGRILIAYLFIPSGFSKLMGFAVAAELGRALLLLVGWQTRWAALGLAIFVAVITPIFHNYWAVPEAQVMMQKLNFGKNLAILGGLLAFAADGAGRLSIDGSARREEPVRSPAYGTR